MTPAQQLAHRIIFDQNPVNPVQASFAQTQAPFSQPRFMPQQPAQLPQSVPVPQPRPWQFGGSLVNSTSQPNTAVPLSQTAPKPGPLSLAPPPQQPLSQFNGASGPQWTDPQWQNFWDRSTPTF